MIAALRVDRFVWRCYCLHRMRSFGFVVFLAMLSSCSGSASTPSPRIEASARPTAPVPATTTPLVILEPPGADPVRVRVEVAATNRDRMRGLMFRERMDADAGMIFLFDRAKHNVFWMHNTLLPLDMIFITTDMRVLGVVESATPQTDDPRGVEGDSQYVLEVNAGYARAHGIGPGTRVRFENISQRPQSEDEL